MKDMLPLRDELLVALTLLWADAIRRGDEEQTQTLLGCMSATAAGDDDDARQLVSALRRSEDHQALGSDRPGS